MAIIITRMNDTLSWLSPLLQVSDSAFPTGSYAHSSGFEQMVALGVVRDEDSIAAYIANHVGPALVHFELPVVRLAHEASNRGDISALMALDEIVDASKGARELREASRVVGRRRLHALRGIGTSSLPAEFVRLIDEDKSPGHHAVIFGGGLAGTPESAVLNAWCLQAINAVCLAAPKLLRIGQTRCKGCSHTRWPRRKAASKCRARFRRTTSAGSTRRSRLPPCSMRLPMNASSSPDGNGRRPVRVGVGGPVGSGKTMLVLRLCEWLREELDLAVITNDIYTREDAEFLVRQDALAADRVLGVETGGCPHTAIRDDTSMNLAAVRELERRHPSLELILIESGGDNLSATFSPELVDAFIYVIDVAEGDKIPRKGGPAIRTSDLLLINKITLAPYVGADLEVMRRDSKLMRGERPFLFADVKSGLGRDEILAWLKREYLFV